MKKTNLNIIIIQMIIIIKFINNFILFNKISFINILSILNSVLDNCFVMKRNASINSDIENKGDISNKLKFENNNNIIHKKMIRTSSYTNLKKDYEKKIKKDKIEILETNGEVGYTLDYNQYLFFNYDKK